MLLNSIIAVVALSAGMYCGGLLLTQLCGRYRAQLAVRLRDLQRARPTNSAEGPRSGLFSKRSISPSLATQPKNANGWITDSDEDRKRHQARLVQAGIYNPSALFRFFVVKRSLILVPPLLGILAGRFGLISLRLGLLWGAAGGALGMLLPSLWLQRRIRHRHCMFRRSLADFLDLMIVCLEGGLSLQGTIQRVSDELRIAHPELAAELSIVQRDINLGATVDAALRRFADRSGYEGIRSLATFVREAQRFGTQLSEALRLHADMLRSQRENAAEEMAHKAAVKILIPMLLLILPAVFVVLAGPAAIQIQQAFAK